MKKSVLFGLLSVLLVFASCKSKESAYKQAYEKAKAQESAQVQVNAPVQVTPVATTPVASDNYDQTPVRQEQVSAVSVTGTLKAYSVVCGSFSLQTNAQGLKDYLVGEGYAAGTAFDAFDIKDIAPTIVKHLGLPSDGDWEGKALI